MIILAVSTIALAAVGMGASASPPTPSHRVVIENMKFSPAEIEIRLGDRVEFVNSDLVPHTATGKTGQPFDSDLLKSGQTWSFSPQHPGRISYQCKFHPVMEGRIIVRAP